jgi:hypothetical protein
MIDDDYVKKKDYKCGKCNKNLTKNVRKKYN